MEVIVDDLHLVLREPVDARDRIEAEAGGVEEMRGVDDLRGCDRRIEVVALQRGVGGLERQGGKSRRGAGRRGSSEWRRAQAMRSAPAGSPVV
jgi:hypothetical protein